MPDSDQIDSDQAEDDAPPGRLRKSVLGAANWASENRLQSVIVMGLSILMMLALVAVWPKSVASGNGDGDLNIAAALGALDDGAYTHAQEIATKLRDSGTLEPDELGGPLFVLGAVMFHDAENVASNDKKRFYRLAAEQLEESRDRGFPDGRKSQGLYILGKSLFLSGQLASSRTALEEAQQGDDRSRPELHKLLALAYLRDLTASKQIALKEIDKFLSEKALQPEEVHEGLLIKSQVQFSLNDLPGATKTLAQIPPSNTNSSKITLLAGRILVAEARKLPSGNDQDAKREALYVAAIDVFRKAQGQDRLGSLVSQQAMYLIGVAQNESGNLRSALDEFVKTRKQHFDAPVGLVASLHEANLLRGLGSDEEAVAAYRRTLSMAGTADDFENSWLSLRDLRKHIHKAYVDYIESEKFQHAFDIAERTHPIFARVEKMHMTAGARRLWAKSLLKSAEGLYGQKARSVEREARAQLRKAGRIYAHLAQQRIATRHYPEDIWNGAASFLEGQDYRNAAKLLRIYRENEHRAHSAEALVGLGESLLALSQIDESIEAIQQCVREYPRHAATYRARLLGSKAYTEKGEPEKAEKLLLENLNSELTPASQEWRDSLFALGKLLYASGKYEQAVTRLEEAVARYPETRQALEARYRMAEAYRAAARESEKLLDSDTIQTARVVHMRQMQHSLAGALNQYDEIRRILNRRQETSKLTTLESAILRNCYFAQGATLYNLRRYDEAIEAYSTATNRYQHEPEVLAAFLQISDCYRRLGKRIAARGNIERAKLVLSRFPQDVDFAETTNFTRDQWTDLLELYGRL